MIEMCPKCVSIDEIYMLFLNHVKRIIEILSITPTSKRLRGYIGLGLSISPVQSSASSQVCDA